MMTRAMELDTNVMPVPRQPVSTEAGARRRNYDGPPVLLDDKALESVR